MNRKDEVYLILFGINHTSPLAFAILVVIAVVFALVQDPAWGAGSGRASAYVVGVVGDVAGGGWVLAFGLAVNHAAPWALSVSTVVIAVVLVSVLLPAGRAVGSFVADCSQVAHVARAHVIAQVENAADFIYNPASKAQTRD